MGRTQPVKTVVLLFLKKSFVKSVDVFPSLHMWTCILNFFCTWSLFFFLFLCLSSRRICHCLAKTAGECYLRSFLPPSFSPPPSVFSWLSWERPAPSMTKNSRTERCCRPWFCTLCLESSEEAWVVLVVLSVQPLSERGGRRLCRRDAVGVWLRPAGSSGCCPWCWKPFCLFQLLSHWLLISHSLFLVLGYNLWILCSHIQPSAVPIPLFWIPLPLSPARIPRIYLVVSL